MAKVETEMFDKEIMNNLFSFPFLLLLLRNVIEFKLEYLYTVFELLVLLIKKVYWTVIDRSLKGIMEFDG
jgi:hypothetical protein